MGCTVGAFYYLKEPKPNVGFRIVLMTDRDYECFRYLLAMGCFSRDHLIEQLGSSSAANRVIYEYQKKGLIEKVKRDFERIAG